MKGKKNNLAKNLFEKSIAKANIGHYIILLAGTYLVVAGAASIGHNHGLKTGIDIATEEIKKLCRKFETIHPGICDEVIKTYNN